MFPFLPSLQFSEFGRFGITNQTHPKLRLVLSHVNIENIIQSDVVQWYSPATLHAARTIIVNGVHDPTHKRYAMG